MAGKAAILARVSTAGQEDNYSLPTQIEACRRYAEQHGFDVIDVITDDCSGSIPVADRPGGGKVYEYLRDRAVQVVIMYTIDRSARDKREYPIEFLVFLRDVQDAGAELHFCDTGRCDGGIVDMFKAWQAANERRVIRERTTRGRRAKARAGHYVGGPTIHYGFKWVGKGADGRLEIDEEAAGIVRQMYEWYVRDRLTLNAITQKLNDLGIPSPIKKTVWRYTTVRRLIVSSGNIGIFHYAGIEINRPDLAIVDRETWDAAQQIRPQNRARARRNAKADYLLSGFFKCVCGAPMYGNQRTIKGGNLYRFYHCSSPTSYGKYVCDQGRRAVNAARVEPIVWDYVRDVVSNPDELRAGIDDYNRTQAENRAPMVDRLATVKAEQAATETKIERLVSDLAAEENQAVRALVRAELGRLTQAKDAWAAEAARLAADVEQHVITAEQTERLIEMMAALYDQIESANYTTKRDLLDALRVVVKLQIAEDGGRQVEVSCAIAPARIWRIDDSPLVWSDINITFSRVFALEPIKQGANC